MLLSLRDGTLVEANDQALRLYRAEREWLLGRRPWEIAAYDVEQMRSRIVALQVGEIVHRNRIRDPSRWWPVPGGGRDHSASTSRANRDCWPASATSPEQKRLEAETVVAQKMDVTGRLAPGVAHELGNPLAAILGFSQLIRRDPSLPEDLRHNADLLASEAERTRPSPATCWIS